MSLPLTVRKSLRDAEPKLQENLQIINQATGKEWTFEADWAAITSQIEPSYKDRVGSLYYEQVMGYLATNIKRICANETTKEAFVEATSANKIIVQVNDKAADYWVLSFANGELTITHRKNMANMSSVEWFDIVAVLPTPGMPLQAKLNLQENQEKLDQNLEKIANATGQSDWTLEVDFGTVLPQLSQNEQNRIGSIYYDQVMSYFASNLERSLKNEILKEAFNEATSEKKIEIVVNDKAKDYWDIAFKNGGIVITHRKNLANLSSVEWFDLAPIIPSPGLSLVTKINLNKEENQEKLRENLQRINQATGTEDWSFEADFPAILPQLDKNTQDRIGDVYYNQCLSYLASCIESKLKEETVKEAFNEVNSNHKIIFRVNDKSPDYWVIKFQNGDLIVEHKKTIANLSSLEYFDLERAIPTPGLSLVTKLNLEKNKEKLDETLEEIGQITGNSDWVFETDIEAAVKQLEKNDGERIGSIYYTQALPYLKENIKRRLANETVKEAFNEVTTEKKIIFQINDKQKDYYWKIEFKNGALVVTHKKSMANMSELEWQDFAAVLPVPGTYSLIAKLNLEEYRPKLEEHLARISKATGQDYTFDDACLEAIYPKLDKNEQERIGRIFYDEIMNYLASNFERSLKDEMVLEAFNEVTNAHQITLEYKKPLPEYWQISFKNGVVVLSFHTIANTSSIEYFNIEPLL